MDNYYLLGLVALVAAIIKLWVLKKAWKHTISKAAIYLSLCLILQNFFEFLVSLIATFSPESVEPFFYLVIVSLGSVLLALVYLSAAVAQSRIGHMAFSFFAIWLIVLIFLQINGLLISGFEFVGYSVISVPGPFFPISLAYGVCGILATVLILVSGTNAEDNVIASRSKVAVNAVISIVVVLGLVLVLRILGFNASTGVALPIASTIFLWILLLNQGAGLIVIGQTLRDQWSKFFIKWQTLRSLAVNMRGIDPTEWHESVDQGLIDGALKKKSTVQDAAKLLGMPRTTLNTKIKKRQT